MAEFLTVHSSWTTKYSWKNSYRNLWSTSPRFVWHLLWLNWSIIRSKVSLWRMLEHGQIVFFDWKMSPISNSCEWSKPHCASNNWPIWTQCQKKRKDVSYQIYKSGFKNILLYTNWGLANICSVHTYVIPWMFYFGGKCTSTFYDQLDDIALRL